MNLSDLKPTAYLVGNLIEGTEWDGIFSDQFYYDIRLEWRGIGKPNENSPEWAILYRHYCINKRGQCEYEPQPSSRTDAFKKRCRFTLGDALDVLHKYHHKLRREALETLAHHGSPQKVLQEREAMKSPKPCTGEE